MQATMQLGLIGLGPMGGNIVHLFDQKPSASQALNQKGVTAAADLSRLLRLLNKPRAVRVMLPVGETTEKVVARLSAVGTGNTIIDGGNAFYKDDICRVKPSNPRASTRSIAVPAVGSGGLTAAAEVLSAALHARFPSRKQADFADKLLSATRNVFGGHLKPKVAR